MVWLKSDRKAGRPTVGIKGQQRARSIFGGEYLDADAARDLELKAESLRRQAAEVDAAAADLRAKARAKEETEKAKGRTESEFQQRRQAEEAKRQQEAESARRAQQEQAANAERERQQRQQEEQARQRQQEEQARQQRENAEQQQRSQENDPGRARRPGEEPSLGMLERAAEILELRWPCSREAARRGYFRLMKKWHPDRNPGDSAAHDMSCKLNVAWELLEEWYATHGPDPRRS